MVRGSGRKDLTNKPKGFKLKFHNCINRFKLLLSRFKLLLGIKESTCFELIGFDTKLILDVIGKEISDCYLKSKTLTILIIEIDHYKNYIETFGIEAGKKVITTIKETIDKKIRGSDYCFSNDVGKFIIVFPEAIQEEVLNIANRVRDIVTKQGYSPYEKSEQIKIKLTVSIGSAHSKCKEGNNRIEVINLIKRAETALLEGKKRGINQINLGD